MKDLIRELVDKASAPSLDFLDSTEVISVDSLNIILDEVFKQEKQKDELISKLENSVTQARRILNEVETELMMLKKRNCKKCKYGTWLGKGCNHKELVAFGRPLRNDFYCAYWEGK